MAHALIQQLRQRLTPETPPLPPGDYSYLAEGPLFAASVLVPIVLREQAPTVLLTQRTAHLRDHAGQVSFPGGRVEPGDDSPEATALREAEEEIGLAPEVVEVIGRLPPFLTVTGFIVTPVVGLVRPPFDLRLDAFEVAEVFEPPLSFLLDEANHIHHELVWRGHPHRYWSMPWQGYNIWGATAGMLRALYQAASDQPYQMR